MVSDFDASRGIYFKQEIQPNIYSDLADSLQQTLANIIIFIPININVQFGGNDLSKKQCHLCFKNICGPKANNCGNCLILLVTVSFIGEESLSLLTLLKKVCKGNFALRNYCRYVKMHSNHNIFLAKVVNNQRSVVFLSIEHFNLTPLC